MNVFQEFLSRVSKFKLDINNSTLWTDTSKFFQGIIENNLICSKEVPFRSFEQLHGNRKNSKVTSFIRKKCFFGTY